MYDLTGVGSVAVVNQAVYSQVTDASGTGSITPFVRLNGNDGQLQGYNTSARPLRYDENNSPVFTRDLPLAQVPLADPPVNTQSGVTYREFLLDINQPHNATSSMLSLDKVEIYLSTSGGLRPTYDPANGLTQNGYTFTRVYSLDAGGDNWVKLSAADSHGSGTGDMKLYVRNDAFATGGTFVYFYSKFGEHDQDQGGFEEWAVNIEAAKPPYTIAGTKFEDGNGNGQWDTNEGTLPGWTIYADLDGNGAFDAGEPSAVTGTDGTYSFSVPAAGDFVIREVLAPGWTQTAPAGGSWTVNVSDDAPSATGVDFGNFKNVLIGGMKFFDTNANGVHDAVGAEPTISGWAVNVLADADHDGLASPGETVYTVYTNAQGQYSFEGGPLPGGQYVVTEDTFTQSNYSGTWIQTAPTNGQYVVQVTSGAGNAAADFGNLKVTAQAGHTIGFWSNKNGQALVSADDLGTLRALNLRNANGSNFDPTTVKDLANWLTNATATNMANMLSAQFAAMTLNVRHGIVAAGSSVYLPGLTGWSSQGSALASNLNAGSHGIITDGNTVALSRVMMEADAILAGAGNVVIGSSNSSRKFAEALKIVLDAGNNNLPVFVALWHDDNNNGVMDPGEA